MTMPPTAATTDVKLPNFKKVDPPKPRSAQKAPNPYDTLIHELALEADASPTGYSTGRSADFRTAELANVHVAMVRRAARNHEPRVGVSVIVTPDPTEGSTKVNLTFAVIPKRVVNRSTGATEAPAQGVDGQTPAVTQ